MKLLVLYEELAPYFLKNIEYFATTFNVPVLIVSKNINPVAPFHFNTTSHYIKIINRDNLSYENLLQEILSFQPTALMQSGWIYKPYFSIVEKLQLKQNILLLDNQWKNTLRQIIGSWYFKWKYKKLFNKAFVPGSKQKQFARHLGFKEQDIELGFYCCDTALFESVYQVRMQQKERHYTFLFIGRYAPEKNIQLLWDAFIEVCKEYPNQWQLLCVGKGDVTPVQHPQIKHLGFKQPDKLMEILLQTDVFVLPSIFEPWGVVIHEVATAGLPIISSNKVGANEYFVIPKRNGIIFSPTNKQELKTALIEMMQLNDDVYFKMCEESHNVSQKITSEKWIKKIYDICQ